MDLTLLAPDIQEALLFGEAEGLSERKLRTVVAAGEWGEQRARLGGALRGVWKDVSRS